jgi:putative addiction module component (TIGR02574 family)
MSRPMKSQPRSHERSHDLQSARNASKTGALCRNWRGLFDSLCRRWCYFQTMTAALKSIAETVEQLPAKERIYLAERLLASLEDAELEKEWADEAIRRRDEVRSGKVKAVPAAEVYRRIERLLAK